MSKNKKIFSAIVIIIVLLGISAYFYSSENKNSTPIQVELSYIATENSTVYDFMDQLREEGKITFTEKTYAGMGKFISSINGIKGNGEQNWIYSVNGKEAQVGVSNYKINPGDVVSWRYEKANF